MLLEECFIMKKIAFIFPGQGAQLVGMGKDFYDTYTVAKRVYEEADEILGYKLSDICFNGSEEDLSLTENTQPAILITSIAILEVLRQKGLACDYTAGLSLGEYSALVNAKSVEFKKTVKLVRDRGIYMQQAVPIGVGRMGAIVGLSLEQIGSIVEQAKAFGLIQIANYNTYEQTVLSGEKKAISVALKKAKELGARKALPLLVSAPFHCSLLETAGSRLEKDLNDIEFKTPSVFFISNVSGETVNDIDKIKQYLIRQVSSPVLWRQSMESMLNMGVRTFIEIGPGTTLSNFAKAIAEFNKIDIIGESVCDIEGLDRILKIIQYI